MSKTSSYVKQRSAVQYHTAPSGNYSMCWCNFALGTVKRETETLLRIFCVTADFLLLE